MDAFLSNVRTRSDRFYNKFDSFSRAALSAEGLSLDLSDERDRAYFTWQYTIWRADRFMSPPSRKLIGKLCQIRHTSFHKYARLAEL